MVPVLLFLLVVVQNLLADILFLGRSPLEISLLIVIYVAFRTNLLKGALISFFLGLVMDGVSGTVTGTYIFLYFLVYSFSHYIARRLYWEGDGFIVTLVFSWGIVESMILLIFKSMLSGHFSLSEGWALLFPQIIPLCVLGPFLFRILDRLRILNGFDERSFEHT